MPDRKGLKKSNIREQVICNILKTYILKKKEQFYFIFTSYKKIV